LVPFLAVSSQCLQAFRAGSGVELARRQDGTHPSYAVIQRELRDDAGMSAGVFSELLHAALAASPLTHAPVVRPERIADSPTALAGHAVHDVDVVSKSLA